MTAQVLVSTANMDRQEWLEWRRKGIGGSDAPAVVGLSPWKSPIQLYMEKVGEWISEEEPSEAAYIGTRLENVLAEIFSEQTGMKVMKRNAILQHTQYPWMIANIDRRIVGKKEGLEIKTASEYLKDEWKDDEVPAHYLVQVQHYMAVTGYDAWWVAVLIGGNKFRYKRIERDDELIQQLIELEKDFWQNNVLKNVPPEMDGSNASSQLLKRMYPKASLPSIDLPSQAKSLVADLESVKAEIKILEDRKNELENKLKSMLGEHEEGRIGDVVVSWKNVETKRIDTTRLKNERPEIYEQYLKVSSYRKFDTKRLKEA